MGGKRDKRSAILVNLLKMEISSSSLEIIHELWGRNNNIGSSSTAKLINSREGSRFVKLVILWFTG